MTIFVQGSGRWRQETDWPIPRTISRTYFPTSRGDLLCQRPDDDGLTDPHDSDPTVGVGAGLYDPLGLGVGFPGDQHEDDRASLTFTSSPLSEDAEITGAPETVFDVLVEGGAPIDLAVKIVDLPPNGPSTLVTTGWTRVEQSGRIVIRLFATSYLIRTGNRLRLSVACADFPRFWPTRSPTRIRLGLQDARVTLPVVPASDALVAAPRPPVAAERPSWSTGGEAEWRIERNEAGDSVAIIAGARDDLLLPSGGSMRVCHSATASVAAQRPDMASVAGIARIELDLASGERVDVEATGQIRRDSASYTATIRVDGRTILEESWAS